ncbi:ribonuclease HII [Bacteriovorax sp. Seq25_V]|uniref:ribonuclease HII n=1 Tax=Bacteriovorax sp. Seq25_V TaxID=1201288 RepID=UPI000389F188|nr:ribonuclease HII [Bacteriovorax sp. Seq25_V]EQC44408.1 ribonuclease HII [Bacteriovorax sp. Seq25_V]
MSFFEKEYIKKYHRFIAATDEVGRGPLAGPVVATSVCFDGDLKKIKNIVSRLEGFGVTDSKKLTDNKRRKILQELNIDYSKEFGEFDIDGQLLKYRTVEKCNQYIEEHNILKSSLDAMKEAVASFGLREGVVLIDGNKKFDFPEADLYPIVKGDSKSVLIGLSSIIAKIYRDDLMIKFSRDFPHYGFEKNAGYPTAVHRAGISEHGITPIHRKTFKGVKEFVNGREVL